MGIEGGNRASAPPGHPGFCFGKENRLLRRSDYRKLAKEGRRIHGRLFIAVILPGNSGGTRLGITVTRRTGTAVIRNRIKRVCREYFRKHRHHLKGRWDLNLIAKKQAADATNRELIDSLEMVFRRVQEDEARR